MAKYEETTPSVNNDGVILTSTLWNQSGTIYVSVDGVQTALTGYTYNQYSPYTDYDMTTRSVTGCTNTAHSQILYYWLERGYHFDLSVSETDYYYQRESGAIHYVSDTPALGEGSMSEINQILSTDDPIGNGDFIAALNYFCAVKNHSSFGISTSTSVYSSVRTDGTNALPFKAVGFDSYFTISDTLSSEKSRYFFSADGTPSEEGLAILRENLDYGEVISVGIPGHSIYMDGYRFNSELGEYEYHLNYGWGKNSKSTKWYTSDGLASIQLGRVVIDLSPDISVMVTNDSDEYCAGSFLRGMERINHIQNEKDTVFAFASSLAGSVIDLNDTAEITAPVGLDFRNFCVSLGTTDGVAIQSEYRLDLELIGGSILVDSGSPDAAVFECGGNRLSVSLDHSYIYTGCSMDGLDSIRDALSGAGAFPELSDPFYDTVSVSGCSLLSGDADDAVVLVNHSALLGRLDLGDGSNTLSVENGSLVFGAFSGGANTLDVNLSIRQQESFGPMIVWRDTTSENAFFIATGGTFDLDFSDLTVESGRYDLYAGVTSSVTQQFSVNLSAYGTNFVLDPDQLTYEDFTLVYDEATLGIVYSSNVKPTVSSKTISADSQLIAVYASYNSNTAVKQYSWDNKNWQTYTAPVIFQANKTVYFRGINSASRVSDVTSCTIADIIAPAVYAGGTISDKNYVYAGGTATSNTVVSGGIFVIREGGRASTDEVNSGGMMYVSGGIADHATVNSGGNLRIYSAGSMVNGTINTGGNIHVYNAGSARSASMISGGRTYVSSGGSSIDNCVSSGGLLLVSSGGSSLRDQVYAGGNVHLYNGAQASSAAVYSQGILRVSSGAASLRAIGRVGAAVHVFGGGRTTSTTVIGGGREYVRAGASATTTIVSSGGLQLVSSGGSSIQAHVRNGGNIYLYTGACGFNTNVSSGGVLRVSSAAIATSAIVRTGGIMNLYGTGIASAALIVSGGRINVQNGCSAADTKVSSGGILIASAGGKVTGTLTIVSGATVRFDAGSVLNFDISAKAAGGAALMNNLALVKGTPSYTLTVNASQATGTYRLADGVNSFTGSITVKSGSTNLGTVTTASSLVSGSRQYALSVAGGRLNLAVTAVECSVEELMQSALQESCMPVISSSGFSSEVGGLTPDCGELSVCTDTLLEFGSSTRTAGGMLAG